VEVLVTEPVRVRRLTDQEGQRLQQIVRRGSTNSVRYRRAMMVLASADGNRVPVIAKLVAADEDTVREVIHRFNEIGLACLEPSVGGTDLDYLIQDRMGDFWKIGIRRNASESVSTRRNEACRPAFIHISAGQRNVDLPSPTTAATSPPGQPRSAPTPAPAVWIIPPPSVS
jgi:hypothetical protein